MVAAETGVSVEKCKRRWRQIRTDYVRWMNTEDHRQRNGLKKPSFYLADELKFMKRHMSLSDLSELEMTSSERERDSKSKSKEPAVKEDYKDNEEDNSMAVDEQPLSKLKQTAKTQLENEGDKTKINKEEKSKVEESKESKKSTEEESSKKAEKKEKVEDQKEEEASSEDEGNSSRTDEKKLSEDRGTPTKGALGPIAGPEFFIKQRNKGFPNCLVIGKKPASEIAPVIPAVSFEQMDDDSFDETASIGGGRRLRRKPAREKQLAIQKTASEQRLTRLQRRKSMTIAAANSLRSSTSPVKMTPLPRTKISTTPTAAKNQPKTPTKQTTPKSSSVSSRDDIFPRPRAAAPTSQQVVLARRPGQQQTQQHLPQHQPQQSHQQQQQAPQVFPVRQHNGVGRPPVPARVTKRTFAVHTAQALRPQGVTVIDPLKMPSVSVASSTSAPLQRLVSSSNTLLISTTSSHVNSLNTSTISTATSTLGSITASITASPIMSTTPPIMTIVKRFERSTQTESPDIFSDDHFLDLVRPQMREMNSRQKMHFKQKIFQALMETFDDATDFPNSGEVQHFNINTPSGYEHVSDPEMRLVRELVSMVSAAKHSSLGADLANDEATGSGGIKGPQRVFRKSPGTPAGAVTPGDKEKRLYRILPMTQKVLPSGYAYPAHVMNMRKDSIDSNSSSRTVPGGRASFIVPGSSPKTARIQDPLTSLLATGPGIGGASKASPVAAVVGGTPKEPVLIRQMGRRYSVCAPSTVSASPIATSSGATNPGSSPGNGVGLAALIKRRLANPSQSMVPPQQRARYNSQFPGAGGHVSAVSPGTSLVSRHAVAGAQKQISPTGGDSVPQKSAQIASTQGGSFNAFTPPNSVRGNNPSGSASSTTPLKRGMVIANVKGSSQQKSSLSAARPNSLASASQQGKSTSVPNVANLLGDYRPQNPGETQTKTSSHSQSQSASSAAEMEREATEMAGIIAADYFDMSRLKREPHDIVDDDILGM